MGNPNISRRSAMLFASTIVFGSLFHPAVVVLLGLLPATALFPLLFVVATCVAALYARFTRTRISCNEWILSAVLCTGILAIEYGRVLGDLHAGQAISWTWSGYILFAVGVVLLAVFRLVAMRKSRQR
ncbi:MAG: hypothetical protein M3014_12750 [Chloroflexota bacterium]|nr:hypothetical protein [Chloroflexota bacterium]